MSKYYARTFLPWIVLAVGSGVDNRVGAVDGLIAALVLIAADRRAGRRFDELILDLSTTGFMALFALWSVFAPDSPALDYGTALAMAWLGATAWLSLALRRPFTRGIARRTVSEEIARTTAFERVNVIITLVWALCFTLEAVSLAVVRYRSPHSVVALVACKVALVAAAAIFTARYPEYARRRADAAASTMEEEPA
ncbi:hypothetical protein [Nocardia spumae]|uniref:hypothetical protein n=1 Tax=Nocardia spumae TaxID=2887190 RepID=UPI001D13434D|nr:hypothetical protein [Nocardia spumae]